MYGVVNGRRPCWASRMESYPDTALLTEALDPFVNGIARRREAVGGW
jgi:hypothetical protein